jgi:hypothetical protein
MYAGKVLALFVLWLLAWETPYVVAKRKIRKKKGSEAAADGSPSYKAPEVEEITYKTEDEKEKLMEKMRREQQEKAAKGDPELTATEKRKLKEEEKELRIELARAVLNHGDDSKEKATVLHKVGANLFKQKRFDDIFDLAMEILRIHEAIDGPESKETAMALSNVGQVAYRTGRMQECEWASYRYVYIQLKHYGKESPEVLLARARLMQYHFKDGETTSGISYEEYLLRRAEAEAREEEL